MGTHPWPLPGPSRGLTVNLGTLRAAFAAHLKRGRHGSRNRPAVPAHYWLRPTPPLGHTLRPRGRPNLKLTRIGSVVSSLVMALVSKVWAAPGNQKAPTQAQIHKDTVAILR